MALTPQQCDEVRYWFDLVSSQMRDSKNGQRTFPWSDTPSSASDPDGADAGETGAHATDGCVMDPGLATPDEGTGPEAENRGASVVGGGDQRDDAGAGVRHSETDVSGDQATLWDRVAELPEEAQGLATGSARPVPSDGDHQERQIVKGEAQSVRAELEAFFDLDQ